MKRGTRARQRTRSVRTVRGAEKERRRKHQQRRPDRKRKLTRRARAKRNAVTPRTAKQFFAMSKQAQDTWTKATHVVSEMRRTGVSLRHASREVGVDPKVIRGLVGKALRKQRNGQYTAHSTDKLLRVLIIPTRKGLQEIATRDSRQASLVARYWIALSRYLTTGDASALREFKGKKITDANGKRIPLLTDISELDRLASAGVLSFETIYAQR